MTDQPRPNPSRAWNILILLIGSILLLPGLCAGFFVVAFLIDPQGILRDPRYLLLWVVCFAIAAGGIALIWLAVKRLRA